MALAALQLAWTAQAQDAGSVSDYRLPPPSEHSPAPVEGPVDSDHPIAVPASPAAENPPAVSPGQPSITLPAAAAPPVRRAGPARQRTAPFSSPGVPAATPSAAPIPIPEATPPAGAASPSPLPSPVETAQPTRTTTLWWLPLLGGLILLVAAAAVLWLRKRTNSAEAEPVQATAADHASDPSAPATLTPIGDAPRKQALPSLPTTLPLALTFQPQSMRLSFIYATLAYRLELTNHGETPLHGLRISGDLASGHVALPVDRQLAPEPSELPQRHDVDALAPGEALTLSGEMQCPIAEILPLRAGAALMFAPLARFRIVLQGDGAATTAETFVFTLGLPSPRQGETMQPFRLDLGPQLFKPIEQRLVDAARWLELDQLRAAG